MTEEELKPGLVLKLREASNTISRATYDIEVEIVWVGAGDVYYWKSSWGIRKPSSTPIERFLDIVNNQPREWH